MQRERIHDKYVNNKMINIYIFTICESKKKVNTIYYFFYFMIKLNSRFGSEAITTRLRLVSIIVTVC